jgi:hypothetical protein
MYFSLPERELTKFSETGAWKFSETKASNYTLQRWEVQIPDEELKDVMGR